MFCKELGLHKITFEGPIKNILHTEWSVVKDECHTGAKIKSLMRDNKMNYVLKTK